jgi:hypothetical protein
MNSTEETVGLLLRLLMVGFLASAYSVPGKCLTVLDLGLFPVVPTVPSF